MSPAIVLSKIKLMKSMNTIGINMKHFLPTVPPIIPWHG
jgi:hypothetical protein